MSSTCISEKLNSELLKISMVLDVLNKIMDLEITYSMAYVDSFLHNEALMDRYSIYEDGELYMHSNYDELEHNLYKRLNKSVSLRKDKDVISMASLIFDGEYGYNNSANIQSNIKKLEALLSRMGDNVMNEFLKSDNRVLWLERNSFLDITRIGRIEAKIVMDSIDGFYSDIRNTLRVIHQESSYKGCQMKELKKGRINLEDKGFKSAKNALIAFEEYRNEIREITVANEDEPAIPNHISSNDKKVKLTIFNTP